MKNERLNFSTNWNGKLFCNYFTTIRLHNPRKYGVGNQYDFHLKEVFMGEVKVIDHKKLTVATISEWIARLDTGYSAEETKNIIRTMYKNIDNFTDDTPLSYVLLHKIKKP